MDKEKEFDNILDECLDRMMFKGESLEKCLEDFPQYADELKPLLETSMITNSVSSLEPDPAFKAKARDDFFSVLRESEAKRSRSFSLFGWRSRWAGAVAGIFVLLAATGGTAVAAMGSMPDDFLYPVKRVTEQVQLAFTFTNLGKAEAYARMANRRVEEIIYMANANDTEEIETLAISLDTSLSNIAVYSLKEETTGVTTESAALRKSVVVTEDEASLSTENYIPEDTAQGIIISSDSIEVEESVADQEPAPAETLETADTLLKAGAVNETGPIVVEPVKPEVNVEIPPTRITASPASPGTSLSKREELNVTVMNQAYSNIQRLYALLDTLPESVRAVVEGAIRILELGYQNAIDSLD